MKKKVLFGSNLEKYLNLSFHFLIYFSVVALLNYLSKFLDRLCFEFVRISFVIIILTLLYTLRIGIQSNYSIKKEIFQKLSDTWFICSFVISLVTFSLIIILNKESFAYDNNKINAIYIFQYIYNNFLFAALFEEIIFRRGYFVELRKFHSCSRCSVIIGVLFALSHVPSMLMNHFAFEEILFTLLIAILKGIFLCLVMNITNNVFICTLFHFNISLLSIFGYVLLMPIIFIIVNQKLFPKKC